MIRQSAATDQYKYNIIYWPDWRCYINTIAPPISYPPLLHTAHRCGSGKQSLVKQGRDTSECRGSALQPVTPSIIWALVLSLYLIDMLCSILVSLLISYKIVKRRSTPWSAEKVISYNIGLSFIFIRLKENRDKTYFLYSPRSLQRKMLNRSFFSCLIWLSGESP